MAVAHSRGVAFSEMRDAISTYRPPRHRCELAAIVGDIEFINDSKSTNLHSLESSLRSLHDHGYIALGNLRLYWRDKEVLSRVNFAAAIQTIQFL